MGGEEVLCLFGSVTGKAESIATQVAKRVFLAFKGRLEYETLRNMLLMDGSLVCQNHFRSWFYPFLPLLDTNHIEFENTDRKKMLKVLGLSI